MGEYAGWTADRYLAAATLDALNILIWQQTEDGHKNKPKHFPKPTWRPGQVEPESDDMADSTYEEQTFGAKGMTTADVDAYFAKLRGGEDVSPSKSQPRTSASSPARKGSKPTSRKNSPQPARSQQPKDKRQVPPSAEASEEA